MYARYSPINLNKKCYCINFTYKKKITTITTTTTKVFIDPPRALVQHLRYDQKMSLKNGGGGEFLNLCKKNNLYEMHALEVYRPHDTHAR